MSNEISPSSPEESGGKDKMEGNVPGLPEKICVRLDNRGLLEAYVGPIPRGETYCLESLLLSTTAQLEEAKKDLKEVTLAFQALQSGMAIEELHAQVKALEEKNASLVKQLEHRVGQGITIYIAEKERDEAREKLAAVEKENAELEDTQFELMRQVSSAEAKNQGLREALEKIAAGKFPPLSYETAAKALEKYGK